MRLISAIHHTERTLSFAKRMLGIVNDDKENRLGKLREHLFDSQHLRHVTDYSFTKIFQQFHILYNTSKIKKKNKNLV